ncbi:MAG TPA: methyltransferase domain-containing protein [Longimicrobiales bacterium]|nr:methyltransferase domain-containing protein [Longimicrobiales bacterium]
MGEQPPRVDHYGSQYGNFATELYAGIRAATYDRDIGQNGWLTASEQDLFLEWLSVGPDHRLLDIACGSGGPTIRIAVESGCSVDGIDIHAQAIAEAERAAEESGVEHRARFHHVDGSGALPFDDHTFDAVTCIDAINHLPDRPRILEEWHRVLKSGGRLVFTDPIVVTGPLTHEEIAIRASIGFFLFVPDGSDDAMLSAAGFEVRHREDRTENMASMAARWRAARAASETDLRRIEGEADYEGQQTFFEVCARLAGESRLSRIAYCAVKS